MYVHSVLLMREGLRHFDPGSDLLVNLQQPAQFLTWRKQGQTWSNNHARFEKLPYGSGVVGAFLGDDFGNISYVGITGDRSNIQVRDYVEYVLPRVRDGYTHTIYNKLFAPPESSLDLIDKLRDINWLYYGISNDSPFEFSFSDIGQCRWRIDIFEGITGILLPAEESKRELAVHYEKIIREIRPRSSHFDITKPVYIR